MYLYQYPFTKVWFEHYERLFNVGFEWDPLHLSDHPPLERPPIPITIDMVKKVISMMKFGKAAGPSGVVVEMTRAASDTGVSMICGLAIAFEIGRSKLTRSRASLSAFIRERVICSGPRTETEEAGYESH